MRLSILGTGRAGLLTCVMCAMLATLLSAASADADFGLTAGSVQAVALNRDGTRDFQAGSHPYSYTVSFAFNEDAQGHLESRARDVIVDSPAGFVGNPAATPRCSREEFEGGFPNCPGNTQIGVVNVGIEGLGVTTGIPLYNVVPPPGMPAQFAFAAAESNVFEDASVRSGSDYGITETASNVPTGFKVVSLSETIWGVPSDQGHNAERVCINSLGKVHGCPSEAPAKALLTLPTTCNGPLTTTVRADSTEDPIADPSEWSSESGVSRDASGARAGMVGCEKLLFNPSLKASPDTAFADTPAGLTAEVTVPQGGFESIGGLSAADVQDTTVTLPAGMSINPGQAAGLQACPISQDGVGTNGPALCPSASKVGTVKLKTPLLEGELPEEELEGNVYVLPTNPPNLELLLAISAPRDGVYLNLIGKVHLDKVTGQITTVFSGTPQLPFTSLKLSFSGGAQAALTTPPKCGVYTTASDFSPWSAPLESDVFTNDSFAIAAGPGGTPCVSSLPFSPSMIAGATTDQAGGYTDFSLLLSRGDGQQRMSGLQFKTPEGLLGMISRVPLCPEPQAGQGTCSSASQIGHTVVEAGPGPYPLVVPQPGQPPAPIYLTAGYKGAPYGLSIVVPLNVGPFTLQTQVVRAKIEVDPLTSRLTVTTDPLPTIIDGIPADLRTINAVIDRPEFMFNPTDCSPQEFSGTATSNEGASVPISSHFQMGSCRSLTFKPNFKVSTSGKTSRKNGASLTAKILYPTGALGANQASSQSNVASVKVDLPKQLPSRLTTLQKACPVATFNANPAACPKESIVGHAAAITPVLPVPVTGPAYFVSHAGEEFPQLIIVLQGYGVTIDLVGDTFIDSKTNITSSTFKQVPDVPITSFELNLPEGPYSALAAPTGLCGKKLVMPTAFTGHNGATIKQETKIAVTGCTTHKKKVNSKAKRKRKR